MRSQPSTRRPARWARRGRAPRRARRGSSGRAAPRRAPAPRGSRARCARSARRPPARRRSAAARRSAGRRRRRTRCRPGNLDAAARIVAPNAARDTVVPDRGVVPRANTGSPMRRRPRRSRQNPSATIPASPRRRASPANSSPKTARDPRWRRSRARRRARPGERGHHRQMVVFGHDRERRTGHAHLGDHRPDRVIDHRQRLVGVESAETSIASSRSIRSTAQSVPHVSRVPPGIDPRGPAGAADGRGDRPVGTSAPSMKTSKPARAGARRPCAARRRAAPPGAGATNGASPCPELRAGPRSRRLITRMVRWSGDEPSVHGDLASFP